MNCAQLKIHSVSKGSLAYRSGLRVGDFIVSINGHPVRDQLDFYYYGANELLEMIIKRNGKELTVIVARKEGVPFDINFSEIPIGLCTNRCIFCFIDQMPPGLRKTLYVKDEDFRYSFLNGNYVTLSSATDLDLDRLAELGISPLYISVHATDRTVRNTLLRNNKAPDILKQLSKLRCRGISFHTQIVVCPGYNDGEVLSKSIQDLFGFQENLLSIAVVPVGLTKFRTYPLQIVDRPRAQAICEIVTALSNTYAVAQGVRKLYVADEFLIRAGLTVPVGKYYGDYPQIENGVGIVRQFLDSWRMVRARLISRSKKYIARYKRVLVLTSVSAYPFVKKVCFSLEKSLGGCSITTTPVENTYFGTTVTVAGLLTAADLKRVVGKMLRSESYDVVVVPGIMFNHREFTLDGYSVGRISKSAGVKVCTAGDIEELVEILYR